MLGRLSSSFTLTAQKQPITAQIEDDDLAMFVVTLERKQGVGLNLVNTVISWARGCGAGQLALWIASDNPR